MIEIEAYKVLGHSSRSGMLAARAALRCRDRNGWLARTLTMLAPILWRLENPQMRWQAEWPGCQRAPRALTRRGVLRKARRQAGGAR